MSIIQRTTPTVFADSAPITVSFPSNVTPGNTVLVFLMYSRYDGSTIGATDNKGNGSYTQDMTREGAGGTGLTLLRKSNVAAAAGTFTVTVSYDRVGDTSPNNITVYAEERNDIDTASPIKVAAVTAIGNSQAPAVSITPLASDDIIVGFMHTDHFTANGGITSPAGTQNSFVYQPGIFERSGSADYKVAGGTTLQTLTWAQTAAASDWAAGAIVYKNNGNLLPPPPTLTGATVNSAGTQITLAWSGSVSAGAGGSDGVALTASGGAVTATYVSGLGSASLVYSLSRVVLQGETLTVAYTQPGNGLEATSGGADVATFSGSAATNSSTVTAPSVVSRAINTAGTQLTITYNASVSIGAGGNGGLTLTSASAPVTATYASGSGSTALVYTLSRIIAQGDTITATYAQPGNGIEATTGGIDVAGYTAQAVTNGSTVAGPNITGLSGAVVHGGSLTITGTGFNATQSGGTVTINGTSQAVTAWSATSITITVARGTAKYGQAVNVVVTNGALGLPSAPFAVSAGVQPAAGWGFVNIGTVNTNAAVRLTAAPDLATGDQVTYQLMTSGSGSVTVNTDGSWSAPSDVASFQIEVWTSPDGWGATAVQTLAGAVGSAGIVAGLLAAAF